MRIPVISFFTGGGFLDVGLHQAGFRVSWTNEHNSQFADMYEAAMLGLRKAWNDSSIPTKVSDRSSITRIQPTEVMTAAFRKGRPDLFGVVGGPPCPDFSNGGTHAGSEGKNGRLTGVYFRMIRDLQPDFFLMENVPGLYRIAKHRTYLTSQISQLQKDGGYAIDCAVLNALELGVPQNRERLFVVGFRTQIASSGVGRPLARHERGWFTWPTHTQYASARSLRWPSATPFGATPKQPKHIPLELTVFPALLGNGDPEGLPNGTDHFNSYSEKFWTRAEGDVSAKSFKRLHRYRFSPTVWYGNQEVHLHPWKPRRLSVREALRIQSVPDEYILPADQPLSAKFKMVCNGVPCAMAREIGNAILGFLMKAGKGPINGTSRSSIRKRSR
jgi:DNA (cytosine-5)-methyltransferase 1